MPPQQGFQPQVTRHALQVPPAAPKPAPVPPLNTPLLYSLICFCSFYKSLLQCSEKRHRDREKIRFGNCNSDSWQLHEKPARIPAAVAVGATTECKAASGRRRAEPGSSLEQRVIFWLTSGTVGWECHPSFMINPVPMINNSPKPPKC